MDETRIEKIKNQGPVPSHVAIIMDGNGRWAKKRGLDRIEGHREGVNSVRDIVEAAGSLDIKALTLYTFSSENWRRPKQEVSALMSLLVSTIKEEVNDLNKKNVRLMAIGDIDVLPMAPRLGIKNTIKKLSKNTGLILNLALSYSGRNEILQSFKTLYKDIQDGRLDISQVDEKVFSQYLQTVEIGDPDLLIRTSGEMRISNFLLWQLAYTELFITSTLWPDFHESDFLDAIESYQQRERRFGKVSEQMQS